MEKKYIHEARYKKGTTRKRRNASTVRSNLNSKRQVNVVEKKPLKTKKVKKQIKKTRRESKVANIMTCIILLVLIGIISRLILKDENEPFIPLPFMEASNDQVIKIGVITEESLLSENTSNVVLNELNKFYKEMLIEINPDYSIKYGVISEVVKLSNKEYIITKNKESKATIEQIKQVIENNKLNKDSIYFTKLQNIECILVVNEDKLNVKLKNDDPYYIYSLAIPCNMESNMTNYVKDASSTQSKLVLNRNKNATKQLPAKIVVTKYKDVYAIVNAYKANEINMFVTNAENVQTLLGKYEYNINTYRNGQSIFLFASPKSNIYSLKEARQVIAYSIDRDGIIKDIIKSKGIKIDLPYIYDDVKYKYDIYAAENILLTNGYTKSNKVYSKTENGVKTNLELDLIVNKNDEIKVSIANKIKDNLSAIGIKVNIEKLTEAKLKTRIDKGNYDLVIASASLNNNPDISFVKNNIFITEEVEQAIAIVENSTIQDLSKNIALLKNVLSEQISTIGIYSDVSYLIYSKDIIGVENVSYMNLFKSILK